jgi:hypothetical protein
MPCGIIWSKVLVRIAALLVALPLTAVACGAQEGSEDDGTRPRYADERERLLATCPAKAQDFFAWQQDLTERGSKTAGRRERPRPGPRREHRAELPANASRGPARRGRDRQRPGPGHSLGDPRGGGARRPTRAGRRPPDSIAAETVRWSSEDPGEFADRLETIRGSKSWAYGFGNAKGRIEVDVPGDAGAARRKISKVFDPCAFTVRGNVRPIQLTRARTVAAAGASTVP